MDSVDTPSRDAGGLLRETVQRSLVLAVVVLPLVAVGWLASEGRAIGGVSFGIYVIVGALLIGCEYALGFNREWGMAITGKLTDFVYVGAATLVEKITFVFCATLVASLGRDLAAAVGFQSLWPVDWNFGPQLLAALLVADFGTYLRHRLFHRSSLLWRFHRIHHSMTGLYWIRSAYTHPIEQCCIMLAIMLPIAFLGAGDGIIAVVAFVYALSGLIQHANVDSHSSVLNYVFATPEVHRVHHAASEEGNRSNFSAFFVFMDLLFGTYCPPSRYPAPFRVGLEGVTSFPRGFLTHLTLPFRRDEAEMPGDGGR